MTPIAKIIDEIVSAKKVEKRPKKPRTLSLDEHYFDYVQAYLKSKGIVMSDVIDLVLIEIIAAIETARMSE